MLNHPVPQKLCRKHNFSSKLQARNGVGLHCGLTLPSVIAEIILLITVMLAAMTKERKYRSGLKVDRVLDKSMASMPPRGSKVMVRSSWPGQSHHALARTSQRSQVDTIPKCQGIAYHRAGVLEQLWTLEEIELRVVMVWWVIKLVSRESRSWPAGKWNLNTKAY